MATLEQNTEHVEEALARLLEQFKHRPNIEAFLSALITQVQDIENSAFDLYMNRWIETAVGVQLDNLGELVKQPREGRIDSEYRNWIKARILVNRSVGQAGDIFAIAELVIGTLESFSMTEEYPAAYRVEVYGYDNDLENLFDIFFAVKPAGVGFHLEGSSFPTDLIFTLAPALDYVTDSPQGLLGTDLVTGGHLAADFG